MKIWNAVTGQHLLTCQDCCVAPINAIAWSPDGSRLASASDDKTITNRGTLLISYSGHSDLMHAVAWSPDGSRLASVAGNGVVVVWQAV